MSPAWTIPTRHVISSKSATKWWVFSHFLCWWSTYLLPYLLIFRAFLQRDGKREERPFGIRNNENLGVFDQTFRSPRTSPFYGGFLRNRSLLGLPWQFPQTPRHESFPPMVTFRWFNLRRYSLAASVTSVPAKNEHVGWFSVILFSLDGWAVAASVSFTHKMEENYFLWELSIIIAYMQ